VRYANVVKGINKRAQENPGPAGRLCAPRTSPPSRDVQDHEFRAWFAKNQTAGSKSMLADLDGPDFSADMALSEEEYAYSVATHSDLLASARARCYRLALERQKPDAKRDAGYQERGPFVHQGARLTRLEQSLVASVDEAR